MSNPTLQKVTSNNRRRAFCSVRPIEVIALLLWFGAMYFAGPVGFVAGFFFVGFAGRSPRKAGTTPDVERAGPSDSALGTAVIAGATDQVRKLLAEGADPDTVTRQGHPALIHAVRSRNTVVAETLLRYGASPHAALPSTGETALVHAARNGDDEIARLLLDRGARVDGCGKEGVTALMWAVQQGNNRLAMLLLQRGASPFRVSRAGQSAQELARRHNRFEILRDISLIAAIEGRTEFQRRSTSS